MLTEKQARNQLGTPGGAKSFLRGAHIFCTMSDIFKLYPTNFSRGGEKFSRGRLYGPAEKYYATTTPATGSLLDAR